MPGSMWDLGFTRQHLSSNIFLSSPNQIQWVPLLVGINQNRTLRIVVTHSKTDLQQKITSRTVTSQMGKPRVFEQDMHIQEEKRHHHMDDRDNPAQEKSRSMLLHTFHVKRNEVLALLCVEILVL